MLTRTFGEIGVNNYCHTLFYCPALHCIAMHHTGIYYLETACEKKKKYIWFISIQVKKYFLWKHICDYNLCIFRMLHQQGYWTFSLSIWVYCTNKENTTYSKLLHIYIYIYSSCHHISIIKTLTFEETNSSTIAPWCNGSKFDFLLCLNNSWNWKRNIL